MSKADRWYSIEYNTIHGVVKSTNECYTPDLLNQRKDKYSHYYPGQEVESFKYVTKVKTEKVIRYDWNVHEWQEVEEPEKTLINYNYMDDIHTSRELPNPKYTQFQADKKKAKILAEINQQIMILQVETNPTVIKKGEYVAFLTGKKGVNTYPKYLRVGIVTKDSDEGWEIKELNTGKLWKPYTNDTIRVSNGIIVHPVKAVIKKSKQKY